MEATRGASAQHSYTVKYYRRDFAYGTFYKWKCSCNGSGRIGSKRANFTYRSQETARTGWMQHLNRHHGIQVSQTVLHPPSATRKLSVDDVLIIRDLRQGGASHNTLGGRFGISAAAIRQVVLGHTYKEIAGPIEGYDYGYMNVGKGRPRK